MERLGSAQSKTTAAKRLVALGLKADLRRYSFASGYPLSRSTGTAQSRYLTYRFDAAAAARFAVIRCECKI